MQKITLDDARRLQTQKEEKIAKLIRERTQSAAITYEDGDTDDFKSIPERTVDDLTAEIEHLRKQFRRLTWLITNANVSTPSNFTLDGQVLSLGELLIAIKQFREELPAVDSLASKKKQKVKVPERQMVGDRIEIIKKVQVTEVLLNTAVYRQKAVILEKMIDAAQKEINHLNQVVDVEFDDVEYVLLAHSE